MLEAVTDGGAAFTAEPAQLAGARARDDGIGLRGLAVLEDSGALEHEAAGLAADATLDVLEAHERGGAVAPIHHQVLDVPCAFDVAGERLGDRSPSELGRVRCFAIGLLVPGSDGEASVRGLFHLSRFSNAKRTGALETRINPSKGRWDGGKSDSMRD